MKMGQVAAACLKHQAPSPEIFNLLDLALNLSGTWIQNVTVEGENFMIAQQTTRGLLLLARLWQVFPAI